MTARVTVAMRVAPEALSYLDDLVTRHRLSRTMVMRVLFSVAAAHRDEVERRLALLAATLN